MASFPPPEELIKINYSTPPKSWMDVPPEFKPGNFSYPAKPDILKYLNFPNPRNWSPTDDDWKLPENWKEIITEGFRER
ncbi:MAG: (Fe-S)-binding protein, partial [Desulfovibrio sp.]|nr:(Fe-S)-binding protein [Desulfovibrio sp.]